MQQVSLKLKALAQAAQARGVLFHLWNPQTREYYTAEEKRAAWRAAKEARRQKVHRGR